MQLGIGPHLDIADIERYSMGTLPEPRIEAFEEHFLACERCQDQLLEMEAYVNAVRSVSPKLRAASARRWFSWLNWPQNAWIAAALMTVVALWIGRKPGMVREPEATVTLIARRGVDEAPKAVTVAGQPLSLEIDLTEIPVRSTYRLEVVDVTGKQEQDGVVVPKDNRIRRPLSAGLSPGRHYVRLYGPGGELLREFGLVVAKD